MLYFNLIIYLAGCEAPRNNPLDPENPANIYQLINGEVKSVSIPYQPLKDVLVYWPENALSASTDQQGSFSLEMIDAGPGWLYFSRPGYFKDSTLISWENSNSQFVEMFLNAHPVIDEQEVYSSIENRYPSLQTEKMHINIEITDTDNDIDSVFINFDILAQKHLLDYNTTSKQYERTFSIYDLDISSLDELVGHPLTLEIKDIFNKSHRTIISSIKRVIRDEIIFISPSGNEITGQTPTLVWQPFNPGFGFTYILEIFTSEITPQLQWSMTSVPDTASYYTVDVPLLPDEYFWVIWAVDEFGNRTRSKPASFKVEQ